MNGLSFCVLDTIGNKVLLSDKLEFKVQATPYLLLKELKGLLNRHNLIGKGYEEVSVIHNNHLFSLAPKPLFDKGELANYLKFNTKILANDRIVYDTLPNQDLVCIYVPFTNVNNYIFECFGEFEFKHSSLAMLQTLFHQKNNKTICYVHVGSKTMELAVMAERKLELYNQFDFKTKEDFLYYVLFTYEQLGLNVEEVKLKLFGAIEEGDSLFEICYQYLKKVSVFVPKQSAYVIDHTGKPDIDLTLLGNF